MSDDTIKLMSEAVQLDIDNAKRQGLAAKAADPCVDSTARAFAILASMYRRRAETMAAEIDRLNDALADASGEYNYDRNDDDEDDPADHPDRPAFTGSAGCRGGRTYGI